MSSRYSQIRIAMNIFEEVARLAPAGSDGDRFEVFISFEGDLPIPVPDFKTAPRVIVTPVRQLLKDGEKFNSVTPIGAARDVTAKGFRLSVCSQDPDFGGLTSFNWVAIEESPDSGNPVPDLITGVLPPMFFGPFRQSFGNNRTFEDYGFGGFGLFDSSVGPVLLTATDHNVQGHSVAAVGMVDNSEDPKPRHDMLAHNVDISAGGCAFNWATFSLEKHLDAASAKGALEPAVETGEVEEAWFEAGGKKGDWNTWDVTFKDRFVEAPIVLVTATQAADIPLRLNAAVVPVVQAATARGFRLAARSGDSRPGLSGFNWIAIGQAA